MGETKISNGNDKGITVNIKQKGNDGKAATGEKT